MTSRGYNSDISGVIIVTSRGYIVTSGGYNSDISGVIIVTSRGYNSDIRGLYSDQVVVPCAWLDLADSTLRLE